MLAALIVVFREVIEAGLIIGIVLAATKGLTGRTQYISGGVITGIIGSCIIAYFADAIGTALEGVGQEIFNASILGIAVIMLTWHNIWMATHGREIAQKIKAVGHDVKMGEQSLLALGIVVCTAVLREGSEVVLFLYGIIASGGQTISSMITGGCLGLVGGAVLSALTYFGMLKIRASSLFRVTKILLAFLAAGMAAQSILYLQQSGFITTLSDPLWDTSFLIEDGTLIGQSLKALMGYTATPNGFQLTAYALTLIINFGLTQKDKK